MNQAVAISTLLFVPGNKPDRFEKALSSGTSVACIDLEDAVPQADKSKARQDALAAIAKGDPRLVLRINAITTRAGVEDVLALADAAILPPLLFVPMVEDAAEIHILRSLLGDRTPAIVPLIETVRGLRNAHDIAAAAGVAAMMFGGGDFSAQLGVELAWEPLLAARGAFILACAGAAIPAIDVPFIRLDDSTGLEAETRAAKAMGFAAKAAIHPNQVETINKVFHPTAEEIAEAEEAVQAFTNAGGAAVRFKGRMLEAPIMRQYQRILAMRSNENA